MSEKTILVPIDFNIQSIVALEQTFNVAKLFKLDIVLLYVYEESGIMGKIFSASQSDEFSVGIKHKLDDLAKETRKKSGLNITTMVAKGKVHAKIHEVADMIGAKFIVMGVNSLGHDYDGRRNIGANTHKVIRSAKKPVITISSLTNYNGIRSILLPIDLTLESRQKVNASIEIAKYFKATIKVVSILWSTKDREVVFKLNAQINQVEKFIEKKGIKCHAEIIEIDSEKMHVPTLLEYAEKQGDIDLIMIMTQQENAFIELFIDSTAQDIIRNSNIPVISITPKKIVKLIS